jgi:hypothetical protein
MRTLWRIAGLQAAAVLLALPTRVVAQHADVAGFVLSVSGDRWFASSRPSVPLKVGQVLMNGDSVRNRARTRWGNSLNIVLYNGDPIVLRCRPAEDCVQPRLIVGRPPEFRWEELWHAVIDLLVEESPRFGHGHVRTADGLLVPLREAVLGSGQGMVDLAPALGGLPAGELRLEAADVDSAASGRWRPLQVTWTPGTPALVPDSAVPAGLFVLRVAGAPDTEAWMLVDASASSPEAAAQFQEISARVQPWSGRGAPENARSALRAALHHLTLRGGVGGTR